MSIENTPPANSGNGQGSQLIKGKVFLDMINRPYMIARGWLHYWSKGNNWVTLRPSTNEDEMQPMLKPEEAKLYGIDSTTQTDAPSSSTSPAAPAYQKAETVICPRCEGWSPIQGLQDTCDLCRGTHRVSVIAAIAYKNEHFDQPTQPKETE